MTNRRAILKGALGGLLGLTLPPFARYAFSQESPAIVLVREGFVMLTGAGRRPCDNGVQHALAPGAGEREPGLRSLGSEDHRARKDPGASGDGLLSPGRGPVRKSAARRGSPDRYLFCRRPDPRRRRADRLRPPARGPHRRRHLRILPRRERSGRG